MLRPVFRRPARIFSAGSLAAILGGVLLSHSIDAYAVRPFVTDDGEVVGDRQLEIATWIEGGKKFFEHNLELTFGVNHWLEVGVGAVHGLESGSYGVLGPLFHVKGSLRDLPNNGWTFAGAVGGVAPLGYGSYKPEGGIGFASGIYTHSFRDGDVLLHANLGVAFAHDRDGTHWVPTVAIGTQFHIVSILHGVTEVFYSDPMDPLMEFGGQVGLRLMFNDYLQVDATAGTEITLEGKAHPWGTLGVRFVTREPKGAIAAEEAREARRNIETDAHQASGETNEISPPENAVKDAPNDDLNTAP